MRGEKPGVCAALSQCHLPGTCDKETGACSNPEKPKSAACNDGNACTATDTCQAGACVGAGQVACTAADQCHDVGVCSSATGVCSKPAKQNGVQCDDGQSVHQRRRLPGRRLHADEPKGVRRLRRLPHRWRLRPLRTPVSAATRPSRTARPATTGSRARPRTLARTVNAAARASCAMTASRAPLTVARSSRVAARRNHGLRLRDQRRLPAQQSVRWRADLRFEGRADQVHVSTRHAGRLLGVERRLSRRVV